VFVDLDGMKDVNDRHGHEVGDRLLRRAASRLSQVVPTGFELVHLALPPGAKPGEGLGTRFIGALRNTDAILIVLRAFADSGVEPDAEGDLAAIELELVMADVESVENRLTRHRKALKARDPQVVAEVGALERALPILSEGTPLYRADLSADDRALLAPAFLLTAKPMLVVCNSGEQPDVPPVIAGAVSVPIDIEAEIAAIEPDARRCGRCTAWASPRSRRSPVPVPLARAAHVSHDGRQGIARGRSAGAKAPECAGVIHSDLQRGFIRAEVIRWDELLEIGSWSKARDAGKLRVEGKDYEVADGDVLEIRFNV
jgi:ribosome-binding ATPase YchF (GTP1/OBG family)